MLVVLNNKVCFILEQVCIEIQGITDYDLHKKYKCWINSASLAASLEIMDVLSQDLSSGFGLGRFVKVAHLQ